LKRKRINKLWIQSLMTNISRFPPLIFCWIQRRKTSWTKSLN